MKRKLLTGVMVSLLLITVITLFGCGGLPPAVFQVSSAEGQAPFNVTLTNKTEVSESDTDTVFKWEFGDGTSHETSNVNESVSHEYTKAGIYTITLSVYKKDSPETVNKISHNVTVTHGVIDSVKITPDTIVLDIGQSQDFQSEVSDAYGNVISTAMLTWTATAGTITDTGGFIAGTIAGIFEQGVIVTAELADNSAQNSVSVTINPDPLESASLPDIEIAAGESVQLQVIAEDPYGNPVENLETTWTMLDSDAGSINDEGLLTAQKKVGSFEEAIKVQVQQGDNICQAIGKVTIIPGTLTQVGIAPENIDLGMGMDQQYVAAGADEYGNRISGLTFTWSVDNDAGTMTSNGFFTTGNNPGTYNDAVVVTATKGSTVVMKTTDVIVNPDRVLFYSNRADVESSHYDIYMMNIDGSNIHRVVTSQGTPDFNIGCSPDGRRIVFMEDTIGGSTVYLANVDGTQQIGIVTGKLYAEPSWSPDGQQIAIQSWEDGDGEIAVIDIDGGNFVKLTDNTLYDDYPDWSPDGTQIVFIGEPNASVNSKVYVMNNDGTGRQQLTSGLNTDIFPKWSPDGTQIVFQTSRGALTTWSIFVIGADGSNLHALSSTQDFNSDLPSWLPDGNRVVFVKYTTTSFGDLCIIDSDGHNLTTITDGDANDLYPACLPRAQGVEVSEASVVINTSFDVETMTAQEITAMASPAVVRIQTDLGSGTGFIIDSNGLIVTNNHVITGASEITVYMNDGTSYSGTVQSRDMVRDLAIVEIQATGLPTLEIASLDGVSAGQQVFVLGYPLGQENVSVTSGLLSSIVYDDGRNVTWLQTDSAVNPGNSGGPLLDNQGRVIGIVAIKAVGVSVEGMGYAISANSIHLYLPELLQ